MGIKPLYNDNLRKLPNEYGGVSVMLILYIFFHDFIHIYSPGAEADNPLGRNFDVNRNILSLLSFVASFKKISLKSDFIQFFHDLNMYIAPGQRHSPNGAKIWCQQKGFITLPICCKFQRNLFQVSFNTIFFMIQYMYIAPGQGAYSPQGTKYWCQQKLLVTLVICC